MELHIVRWGRSAYETEADLALERTGIEALGHRWSVHTAEHAPTELGHVLVVPSHRKVTARVVDRFADGGGQLIQTTTSGYDHVDVACARQRGVVVARLPQARRDAVVEYALAAGTYLMRRTDALRAEASRGRWARGDLPTLSPRGLAGRTVGLVGLGVIGQKMARVLHALDATVLGFDPAGVPAPAIPASLESVLGADLVSVHCSLTPSSRGLLDAARLALMRPHAVLVHTARGATVDPDAAIAMVKAGHLRGAALDVFPSEPRPLEDHPGLLLTPHSAGYTDDLGERVARGVVAQITGWSGGQPMPYRVA